MLAVQNCYLSMRERSHDADKNLRILIDKVQKIQHGRPMLFLDGADGSKKIYVMTKPFEVIMPGKEKEVRTYVQVYVHDSLYTTPRVEAEWRVGTEDSYDQQQISKLLSEFDELITLSTSSIENEEERLEKRKEIAIDLALKSYA